MSLRISRDAPMYCIDAGAVPLASIQGTTEIVFETHDARGGKLREAWQVHETTPDFSERFPKVNPVTGPINIDGAEPGDTISVTIDNIELDDQGFILVKPDMGISHGKVSDPVAKVCRIESGYVVFDDLRFPIAPMVGVIAVAPAGGPVSPALVGRYGGNMDSKRVTTGATLYLPVQVPGALLYVGDVHAAMGDGEVTGTGIEIGGKVSVTVQLIKGQSRQWPWLETVSEIVALSSAPTYEAAGRICVDEMIDLLGIHHGVSPTDAYMLISAVGNVCINQSCGSTADISVRVEMPKMGHGINRVTG
ncbi:acetamidase/formamidase family protein [Devosia sp. 2618]|uniref:acetamidase/formamidase family protein n=1 Tax=Devosia sp. 2618 TaxID=3156454 RepID=UPI0033953287